MEYLSTTETNSFVHGKTLLSGVTGQSLPVKTLTWFSQWLSKAILQGGQGYLTVKPQPRTTLFQ